MNDIKIGYVALNSDLHVSPGDYRRFVYYAKSKGIKFDQATVGKKYDLVILSQGADVSLWKDYPHGVVVYDLIDSYLSLPRNNIKALLRGFMKYILFRSSHGSAGWSLATAIPTAIWSRASADFRRLRNLPG